MTSFDRKPLDQVNKADLQQLIDDQVQESKTIEYKRDIVISTLNKKFLADVSCKCLRWISNRWYK